MSRVQVYGADWCPLTLGLRKYFKNQGLEYDFFDVETDRGAAEADKAMNQGKLKFPMVVVGLVEGYWKPGDDAAVLKNPRLPELRGALERYGFIKPAD
ncbi:MAG: glutaredoxin domain-containing protein [Meiothermus sp.]|nr:glutaredoxin domain-containing protein [Meiothermus sp.]